jgi:hypothetical protein
MRVWVRGGLVGMLGYVFVVFFFGLVVLSGRTMSRELDRTFGIPGDCMVVLDV